MKHKYAFNDLLRKAVIYEVNLRQYTRNGDIASFQKHLPRLQKMGVDILWLMPHYPIGIKNRKGTLGSYYSIKNFTEVNPAFGTSADFKNLVNEVHGLGMKVIIDWVANHASWDNEWTITNPDFFERNENGNFVSPYDWTDVIQINHKNPEAHEAMQNAMCYWIKEYNIDGFRADLAHLTPLDFWVQARKLTSEIKQDLIWLAETEELDYYKAFDIIYSWKWMHATEALFKNDLSISSLKDILISHKNKTPASSMQLFFTTNHDENSWNGTEFEKYGHYTNALFVFNFLYPFSVPLIYSGQEIPIKKRLLFFDKDEIEWPLILENDLFFEKLINLRKRFHSNSLLEIIEVDEKLFGFKSAHKNGYLIVLMNLNEYTFIQDKYLEEFKGNFEILLSYMSVLSESQDAVEMHSGGFLVIQTN